MIRKAEACGDIYGVKICRQTPPISHSFFTNDSVLFFGASVRDSEFLKHILHSYENTSGQKKLILRNPLSPLARILIIK